MNGAKRHRNNQGRQSPDFQGVIGDLSPYEESLESRSQPSPRMHAQLEGGMNKEKFDETSSTSSDKYEKDVNILNRCFDDIEKFIARLQHAAAAFRELEKRRRSRKSKKKDLGDGMLSMRAKPPPEREFEDIFQKFKLSFNLLAKLKAHIHDPNAPELVHFLFTPLALIVDASHDSQYGPNLPTKVLAPLLTKSAVDLLINCLTSKESELWHSLGEPWYVPREQWKGYVPPYKPVFMDGWSPAMYDDYPGSSNGRKYGGEGDDSTINDEEDGVMRAGYTNNYGYGATEGAPPTDSENERGNTPNHYPGPTTKGRSPSEQERQGGPGHVPTHRQQREGVVRVSRRVPRGDRRHTQVVEGSQPGRPGGACPPHHSNAGSGADRQPPGQPQVSRVDPEGEEGQEGRVPLLLRNRSKCHLSPQETSTLAARRVSK